MGTANNSSKTLEHSYLCSGQCVYMGTVNYSKETRHADMCSIQHEETSFKIREVPEV